MGPFTPRINNGPKPPFQKNRVAESDNHDKKISFNKTVSVPPGDLSETEISPNDHGGGDGVLGISVMKCTHAPSVHRYYGKCMGGYFTHDFGNDHPKRFCSGFLDREGKGRVALISMPLS